MAEEILYNSPALHALKRHQLVSLSKRYGLRASGKNTEMIDRLKDFALNLSPSRQLRVPLPEPTPARGFSDFAMEPESSPIPSSPNLPLPVANPRFGASGRVPKTSDGWEVLSESGASLISPQKGGMTKSSSVNSWKSAENGRSLSEFGVAGSQPGSGSSRSKSSSMRALATSLSRRASRHLMSRSISASSNLEKVLNDEAQPSEPSAQAEEVEHLPPSPASTVGVPRRHSTISLLERPSTIRLVVSPPPDRAPRVGAGDNVDELPVVNTETTRKLKERRSMTPLRIRSPHRPCSNALTRKSMPAIVSDHTSSASVPSIYPPLPTFNHSEHIPPVPAIPGAYKVEPSPSKAFTFSVSNTQFEDAGKKVPAEMDARMRAAMGDRAPLFGSELLKGKNAEIHKLVSVREGLGDGGWGLGESSSSRVPDRYAEAHRKEFARMQSLNDRKVSASSSKAKLSTSTSSATVPKSIPQTPNKRKLSANLSAHLATPSAPNGLPLVQPEDTGRETKRKRLSVGPNALGSLRGAGRSIVHLLGEGQTKQPMSTKKRRRSSLPGGKGRSLASRFGLFRSKHKDTLSQAGKKPTDPAAGFRSSVTVPSLTSSSLGSAIRSAEHQDQPMSASRSRPFQSAGSHTPMPSISATTVVKTARERSRSTSAQTVLSTSSSKIRPRPRIPEFEPKPPLPRSGSTNTLGLPHPASGSMSSSMSMSMRKQSQTDLIRSARPAPATPALSASITKKAEETASAGKGPQMPTAVKRSSTLYMPTASSLARMQATVKPSSDRPLPQPPQSKSLSLSTSTSRPLDSVGSVAPLSTRNSTFDTSFNVPAPKAPLHKATSVSTLKSAMRPTARGSPMKTPAKVSSSAAARQRVRASGLSAVKSRGNLKGEDEVAKRRAEIKARQERIGEERGLRELLGGEQ